MQKRVTQFYFWVTLFFFFVANPSFCKAIEKLIKKVKFFLFSNSLKINAYEKR